MSSRLSYPHPVLGNGDDINSENLKPEIEYEISEEIVKIICSNLFCDHPDIEELIQNGKAKWAIRVQCARTYFRETFMHEGPEFEISIEGPELEGTIEIDSGIISTSQINSYRPSEAHPDYDDIEFNLASGELLAIGPKFNFLVDKDYDPLKAPVASLIRVEEGEDKRGPYIITLEEDLILIRLSREDWAEYSGIRDRVPHMLFSSLVVPALSLAIEKMDEASYEGRLWASRLKEVVQRKNINTNHPITAAQELLDNPLSRAFAHTNLMLDKKGG